MLPAAAQAGTYAWNLPADFTVAGANPDHDTYGTNRYLYLDGASATSLAPLNQFEKNVQGGLNGWTDSGDTSTLVGMSPEPEPFPGGFQSQDTFAPRQLVLEPTPAHVVAVRWTSPLAATVTVTGSVISDETSSPADTGCASAGVDTWSLNLDGNPVQNESGMVPQSSAGPQAISASLAVSPGDTIDLVITAGASVNADPACAPVGATLAFRAAVPPPTVTLYQPAGGQSITDGEPTFSGSAAQRFGDSGTITIRIYKGSQVDPGSILQTQTTTRAGTAYSLSPDPFLYDGAYTVQAEQDDILGDQGFSPPVTFTVADPLPLITMSSLGTRPLSTSMPTLSGSSGTISGDSRSIEVLVWAGTKTKGYPVRHLTAERDDQGHWSTTVTPALADGQYVAIAAQNGPAGLIGSQLVFFVVKLHPPVVTIEQSGYEARAASGRLTLSGRAGDLPADEAWVTIFLYRGARAGGHLVARLRVVQRRGTWTLRWRAPLAPGVYTVRVSQLDGAGHVGWSAPRTFRVHTRTSRVHTRTSRARTRTFRARARNFRAPARAHRLHKSR
jgi:hypothetical protein